MAHETDASMGTLLRSTLDDVRDLFREEVALARAELRQELSRATTAATNLGAAAGAGWFAAMFILAGIAFGISAWWGWPYWASFGAVGIVLGLAAWMMYSRGRRALRHVRGMPRTVETVKETFQ